MAEHPRRRAMTRPARSRLAWRGVPVLVLAPVVLAGLLPAGSAAAGAKSGSAAAGAKPGSAAAGAKPGSAATTSCSAGSRTLAPFRSRMYPDTGNGGYLRVHTDVH